MRRRTMRIAVMGFAAAMLGSSSLMADDDGDRGRGHDKRFQVRTNLEGFQEVPAISTTGSGRFRAWIDPDAGTVTWKLSYDALEGTVTQAHVHFGQLSVNGGISFFLCTNLGNGPAGTQACPTTFPAEITGTIVAADVIGPAANGIEAGALAEILAAIRDGTAYANVHSTKWPGGEIRGQLRK